MGKRQPFKKGNREQAKAKAKIYGGVAPEDRKLTHKQREAADLFLSGKTKVDSLLGAGYSHGVAYHRQASVFEAPNVAKYIAQSQQERSKKLGIDADWVLRKAADVVNRCMQEVKPVITAKGEHQTDDDGNLLYTFNAAGALKGLELVGKHIDVSAFKEIVENRNTNVDIAAKMSQDKALETIRQLTGRPDIGEKDK